MTRPQMRRLKRRKRVTLADIRRVVADYIASEGCSCCQDTVPHDHARDQLGKMLRAKKVKDWYGDRPGYDFSPFRSKGRRSHPRVKGVSNG